VEIAVGNEPRESHVAHEVPEPRSSGAAGSSDEPSSRSATATRSSDVPYFSARDRRRIEQASPGSRLFSHLPLALMRRVPGKQGVVPFRHPRASTSSRSRPAHPERTARARPK
jgi:hypothetical protein